MNEGKSCDWVLKKRNALGDVTNLVRKRDFSAISGDVSGDVLDTRKGKFAKQVCSDAENIEKPNTTTEGVQNDSKMGCHIDEFIRERPELKLDAWREQLFSEISKAEAKKKSSSSKNHRHGRIKAVSPCVDAVSKDSSVPCIAKSTSQSILNSTDAEVSHANDEGDGSLGEHCISSHAKPTSLSIMDNVDVEASHLKDERVGSLGKHCVSSIGKPPSPTTLNIVGASHLRVGSLGRHGASSFAKPSSPSILDSVGVDHSRNIVVGTSGEHCVSSIAKPTIPGILNIVNIGSGNSKNEEFRSLGKDSTILPEQCDTVCGNDEYEPGDDNINSSKCESADCFRFPESQESRSSGFERCVGLKSDGFSDSPMGIDLIKSCSCSFCTKAAYMWSDLHYQDIKGRLAALKKSQKEANILVQRCSKNRSIDIHGQGKPDIQSSLMGQWRSLFLHMEGIFGHESSQLVAGLFTLKDVRDNCKTELESMPSGNPYNAFNF